MMSEPMSAKPCAGCEFHTFTYELDSAGYCLDCRPAGVESTPNRRKRVVRDGSAPKRRSTRIKP